MRKHSCFGCILILSIVSMLVRAGAQDRKVERIRVGGGSTSATQMSMWLAKEGGFYDKHGLSVEAITRPPEKNRNSLPPVDFLNCCATIASMA